MSFMDKAKGAAGQAKDRAGRLASEHGDRIDNAIDKGGSFVDSRTHGKYTGKIDKARGSAKNTSGKLAAQHRGGSERGDTSPRGAGPGAGDREGPTTPPAAAPRPEGSASGAADGEAAPPPEQIDPNRT